MTATRQQDSFKDFVLDQLSGLRDLRCRPMFGGFGLYQGAVFFGIIHQSRAYFKVTADSLNRYRAHGMRPFQPNGQQTLNSYYEVPPHVLEDGDILVMWAEETIESAMRVKSARPTSVQRAS